MIEILTAFAGKASEYLVAPIGRRIGYLFCYRSHTDELRSKVQTLGRAKDDLQITIDEATRRGDQIRPVVQEWLNRVDVVTEEAEELMTDKKKKICCLNGWCPNFKSRYLLGREAAKKAKAIVEIQEGRNFPDGVSYSVPPRSVTFTDYESYESRASTLNKIMDALKDDKMKMIGVWGMGGVGKTTLVKQVAEEAKQQNLFTTQVYVDVSWTREDAKFEDGISSIQQHIAEKLGLKLEEKTIPARAGKLMERLKKEKILIILDDLWKKVNLEDVGIPSCNKDCKTVLASRHEYLLRQDMGAQECFQIQYLEEGEAWRLFKTTAGDSVENDIERKPIAIEIVKECGGLPIAIVAIATTLKERRVAVWKNALRELKSPAPTYNKDENQVYKCLALSYNHLKDDELKSLFLLCGCLSYGNIPMDQLLRYALGLDFFDRIKSVEEARDKLVALVSDLKASSLLLDGEDDGGETSSLLFMDAADGDQTVRIHDLVRDVARNIASKDPHRFVVIEDAPFEEDWSKTHESKFISLNCEAVHELPHGLVYPKLQFFLLQNYSPSLNIPNTFFEGMKLLKVLDLSGMDFETLPSTLQSLASLRTLCLDRCWKLRDIAEIGELKKLQVLSMAGSAIRQLPQEMVQLTNLRLLNLNDCEELEEIPRNILSKLSRLECLFMNSSFSEWAVEISDGESDIACLSELNDLDHLTTIVLEIPDVEMVPEEGKFFHNLTSFAIFIGNFDSWDKRYERSKTLRVKGGDESLLLRNGMCKLLEKTEELRLSEFKSGIEDKGKETIRIPNDDGVLFGEKVLCSNLVEMTLYNLPTLKKIWSHNQLSPHSFYNLQILKVSHCRCLVNLIPGRHLMRSFNDLKEMEVWNCVAQEYVFDFQLEGYDVEILPKLETLKLEDLPELKGIFRKNDSTRDCFSTWMPLSFPNLKCLVIWSCGIKAKYHENADISIYDEVLFGEKVSFPNLEEVRLYGLSKLKKIWSHNQLSPHSFPNLMGSLNNLKEMEVERCQVLEHVFDFQLEGYDVEILPKLETLKLEDLPELKGIFRKNDSTKDCFSAWMPVSFPNLKCLCIFNCGNEVKYHENADIPIHDEVLFGEKVSFPNLEEVTLYNLPKLKKIWSHIQLSPHSFSNLRILRVSDCPCLLNLISNQLEGYDDDTNAEIFPKLEILDLQGLVGLKGIMCHCKKNDSTRSCFYTWMPVSFPNLKCLSIDISQEEGKDQENADIPIQDGVFFGEKVSFLNLEELNLSCFSMLKMIWYPQQREFFDKSQMLKRFQNLRSIVVRDCQLLNCLFDHEEILPKIEILKLEKLPNLRHIFYNGDDNDNMRYLFSLSKVKILEHIKELSIVKCGKSLDEEGSFSSNLEVLVLESFFKLKEIYFENLQNLRILALKKLPKLSRIICHEGENDNKIFHLSPSAFKDFHGLKELSIDDCGMEDRRDVLTPANTPASATLLSNEEVPLIFDGGVCNYETFESRAFTFNKMMEALRDDNTLSIGVVGIGGVGKTTLIKQVAHQAMLEKLFTKQVYVDLSWTRHFNKLVPEISRIQEKIAEVSGWKFPWDWDESKRADEMRERLEKERMLIILDGFCKEFDLEKIGIPSSRRAVEMKKCKIVLTCRNGEGDGDGEQLCKDMGAQTCFRVKILPPEEAWSLFKKITSTSDCDCDSDNLVVEDEETNNKNNLEDQVLSFSSIAKQVVEECCEGLPIAIVAIARALKDETQKAVWESALGQLIKNCTIRGNKAYSCLEWCYTHLKPHGLKSLLLLCGVLNYYGDVSMHHLLQYAIGLDLFGCIDSLDQARNKLLELVEILKDSRWLIEMDRHHGHDNLVMIRMHDVVSEIVSKDPCAFSFKEDVVSELEEWSKSDESKSCTFISLQYSKVVHELPHALVCPELRYFLLHNENPSLDISIPNTFFQGMKKLQVLDLSKSGFTILPSSLDSLANLLTLRLDNCKNLVDIAGIGGMKKLQVLSLVSSAIQQLPDEMEQLINLRLLDLDCCRELKEIPRNILSNLSKLECLSMAQSFTEWAMEGDHQSINANNACLSELSHLSYLTTLDIEIPDSKLIPNDIQFDNLTRYAISISGNIKRSRKTGRTLKLEKVNISLDLGDGIRKLLERSEELEFGDLSGNNYLFRYPSNEDGFSELKHLHVRDSNEIPYIIDSMDQLTCLQHGAAFPLLESLVLWWLPNLQELWHGCPIPRGSFGNLKTLEVSFCDKLRYLFYLSTARGLSQLENMLIGYCHSMQQIIACGKESEDEYDVTNVELFPNLRTLKLNYLPELINFMPELDTNARPEQSSFNHKVLFSKLEKLELIYVPKLKDVWNPQSSFGSLSNLRNIKVCPNDYQFSVPSLS